MVDFEDGGPANGPAVGGGGTVTAVTPAVATVTSVSPLVPTVIAVPPVFPTLADGGDAFDTSGFAEDGGGA